jgi:hypothetical protein
VPYSFKALIRLGFISFIINQPLIKVNTAIKLSTNLSTGSVDKKLTFWIQSRKVFRCKIYKKIVFLYIDKEKA